MAGDFMYTPDEPVCGEGLVSMVAGGSLIHSFTYDGVEAVWKAVQDTGRPLAAAALNAGIGIGGAFIDTGLEDELRMIAIKATSQVHLAKRIVPGMIAARSARILFTSSLSATTPTPYETVYGPTGRSCTPSR